MASSLALAGCSSSRTRGRGTDPTIHIDGGADSGGDPGATYAYVINVLNVGRADPAGDPNIVPGFDIDGRISNEDDPAGCFHPDYTSPPPDNEPGVDNQMGPILSSLGSSFDVEGSIAEGIATGDLILLLVVSGVNDTTTDDSVVVEIQNGRTATGAPPSLDAGGRLMPGQTFSVVASHGAVTGRIIGGRLHSSFDALPLMLPVGGDMPPLTLTLRTGQMRFDVQPFELTAGVVGGALDVDETVVAVSSVAGDSVPESLVRSVLEGQADLAPDEMTQCRELSVGLVFEAVMAVVE